MTRFCSSSRGLTTRCGLRSTTRRGSSRCWWTRRPTGRRAAAGCWWTACPLSGDSVKRPRARPCTSRSPPRAIVTRATIATRRAIVTLRAAVSRRAAVTPGAAADRWLPSRPAAGASGTRTCPAGLHPPADPRGMKYLGVFRGSYLPFPAGPTGHAQRTDPVRRAVNLVRPGQRGRPAGAPPAGSPRCGHPEGGDPAGVSRRGSTGCAVAEGCLAGDVYARVDVELLQDVGDVGRDGPPGQEELGADLWVGQSLLHQRGDLGLGRRQAVPAAPRLPVFGVRAAADAMSVEPGP